MNCLTCKFYLDLSETEANGYIKDDKICINDNNVCNTEQRLEFVLIEKEHLDFVKKYGCKSYSLSLEAHIEDKG